MFSGSRVLGRPALSPATNFRASQYIQELLEIKDKHLMPWSLTMGLRGQQMPSSRPCGVTSGPS